MERIELFFILVLQRLVRSASHLAGRQTKSKAQQLTSACCGGCMIRMRSASASEKVASGRGVAIGLLGLAGGDMLPSAREMRYNDGGQLGLSDSSQ